MNTCSVVGVCFSPQIRILHTKRFFAHQLKGPPPPPKKNAMNFKGTVLLLNYICHAFSIQQAAMFAYGSIEDHMFNFITGFFSTSLEMFLYLVLGFLRIIR